MGVGRTAAYRAIDICKELGLIEERTFKVKGKRIVSLNLTEKGKAIFCHIREIDNILNGDLKTPFE
jgi:DNA-binding MarR family transcriptional regulator